ncbi:Histone-lysine N-methyltransferase EHMT1, partial [Pseudolycoriella hygida]
MCESDIIPLSAQQRFKTVQPNMMVRWRNDPEKIIEEQYPSEEYEYMECGPSPPAESAPSMYDSFDEPPVDLSVQICNENLRSNLVDQMKSVSGKSKLLDDIENGNIASDNLRKSFEFATKAEKNISFLWSAFLKRADLLKDLLLIGADLNFCDPNGISALHLAAFSGCLACTSFLIEAKMDVNLQPKTYSPLHFA